MSRRGIEQYQLCRAHFHKDEVRSQRLSPTSVNRERKTSAYTVPSKHQRPEGWRQSRRQIYYRHQQRDLTGAMRAEGTAGTGRTAAAPGGNPGCCGGLVRPSGDASSRVGLGLVRSLAARALCGGGVAMLHSGAARLVGSGEEGLPAALAKL